MDDFGMLFRIPKHAKYSPKAPKLTSRTIGSPKIFAAGLHAFLKHANNYTNIQRPEIDLYLKRHGGGFARSAIGY